MQRTLNRWLIDTSSPQYFLVSDILAFFTVVSIVSIVLETVPSLEKYQTIFLIIEWIAVTVFALEYVARIVVTKPARRYVFSFFGFIDLISIAPTILGLGNFTFLKSARAVRLIRLLRLVRIAKMKHLKAHDLEEKMGFFAVNIMLFLSVLVSSVLFVGTLIYIVEGNTAAFASIPLGMLWALKVFLMGISAQPPVTVGGEVVHIVASLVGLTVFGVLVGVVSNALKNMLFTTEPSPTVKRRK